VFSIKNKRYKNHAELTNNMHVNYLECVDCKKRYSKDTVVFKCECNGALDVVYDYSEIKKRVSWQKLRKRKFEHWRYREFFPITDSRNIVSMGEGGTHLVKVSGNVYLKLESLNPTGSFKDRGTTVEISKAKETCAKKVVCASTGNMGASVSAYCARAGIKARIYLPNIAAETKIKQMEIHGAEIVHVNGPYTKAEQKAADEFAKHGIYLTGDFPYRGEGEKSVAYEIMDELNPDYIACPVGNATLISAVWKGLKELKICGLVKKLPKLIAVQADKCNTVVNAFNKNKQINPVDNPDTIATAIACGNPVDGHKALRALKESNGLAVSVTENEILNARRELARTQGIDCEPSGAVAYAGIRKLEAAGKLSKSKLKVAIVSGSGLKDLKNY
jgi:threonine synthase